MSKIVVSGGGNTAPIKVVSPGPRGPKGDKGDPGDVSLSNVNRWTAVNNFDAAVRFKRHPFLDPTHPDFGMVGDGTANDGAALQTAVNFLEGLSADGGEVRLPRPSVSYRLNTGVLISKPSISIVGPGSQACTFVSHVNGDAFRLKMDPFTAEVAGTLKGFRINHTSALANAVGLHLGDVIAPKLDDISIAGFTGTNGTGLWLHNAAMWTERVVTDRVAIFNCTRLIRASVDAPGQNSFGFNRLLGILLTIYAGQIGFLIDDGAIFYDSDLQFIANVVDAGKVVKINGSGNVEGSRIWWTGEQTSGSGGLGIDAASGRFASTSHGANHGRVQFFDLPHVGTGAVESGLDQTWITPALAAPWEAVAGYQAPRYRRVHDDVEIGGMCQNSSGSATSVSPFTLPAHFRPIAFNLASNGLWGVAADGVATIIFPQSAGALLSMNHRFGVG